jgi:hypothetical protein
MTVHYLPLKISEQEWLRYYTGEATLVHCYNTRGQTIAIAARHFRKFTTKHGIDGVFKLTLNGNRFVSLEQVNKYR